MRPLSTGIGLGLAAAAIVAAAASGNSASWIGYDQTTQGDWVGVYGSDGYAIPSDHNAPESEVGAKSLPAYAAFGSSSGSTLFVWTGATPDARAVEYSGGGGHIASTWYSATAEVFDLTITGTKTLGLYLLDWDASGRGATVTISDADTAATLDGPRAVTAATPAASAYYNGTWLRWTVSGHLTITVTKTAGPNATLSGFFFDP